MDTQQSTPNKRFNPAWIYVPIILLLAGVATYLYLDKGKAEEKNEALSSEVATVSNEKASVETEYNAALVRLDEMKGQSLQTDSLLSSQSQEVEDLKTKIKAILSKENATEAELKEANQMIAQLNKKITSFQEQIVALKQENVQLTEDKRQLIDEKTAVTKEKEALKEDKKKLETTIEKTVETASILNASGFRLEAINLKKNILGKTKEKETEKAKKADLMRITFDLDDNRISESGEKMIYICVADPSGKIASSANGGKFKLADGSEKTYTSTKTIPYKKGEKVKGISTDWKPLDEFAKGNYKVEIYHMGHIIGSEMVSLK